MRIADYGDYFSELQHEYCISTGERRGELREEIFREIAKKWESDHPKREVEDVWEDKPINNFNEDRFLKQSAIAAGYYE